MASQEKEEVPAGHVGREHDAEQPRLAVLGGVLEASACLLTSAVLLQLLFLPLDVLRLGWWPVMVAMLAFVASLCWREEPEALPKQGRLLRLRLSAMIALGMAPMMTKLPVAMRVAPAFLGWHPALCILIALASMIWHQREFTALRRMKCRLDDGGCARLAAMDEWLWRRCVALLFRMIVICVVLLVVASGDFRIGRLPDAVLQGMLGLGQVPVFFGSVVCVICAISGVLRLVMMVIDDF